VKSSFGGGKYTEWTLIDAYRKQATILPNLFEKKKDNKKKSETKIF